MKIAIAGYGAEGESNYRYWNTDGNQVVIVDEHVPSKNVPIDASVIIGENAFQRLEGYDLVVRTAGLAPMKIMTDGKIWSATNEFFAECPAPIIGVTGSKGKGTTSSLIACILREAGKQVHLVGNIGVPSLDVLPNIEADDIVVYELSSFQLWDLQMSPSVAVVLMIEPDHLDVHLDMADYVDAKSHITQSQHAEDTAIYDATNVYSKQIASRSKGQQVPFQSNQYAHVSDGSFWYAAQKLCSVDQLVIPGMHNQENACAAIAAVWRWVQDGEVIARGLKSFDGLPHRLRFVRRCLDVSYYDDSIATTPGSARAAIRAFAEPKVLILGGSDKGVDYDELMYEIVSSDTIRAVLTVGKTGERIFNKLSMLDHSFVLRRSDASDMKGIVAEATQLACKGDVVVLSPASASFDMFKSYVDRGNQFIAAVNNL